MLLRETFLENLIIMSPYPTFPLYISLILHSQGDISLKNSFQGDKCLLVFRFFLKN